MIATTSKEKAFQQIASQAVSEDQLNVLMKMKEPPKNKPAIIKESEVFVDTTNKRLSVYINGELHYAALTKA